MNDARFMMKITYPIQFCRSQSEALVHLERLIVGRECGMDEGVQFYISQITGILDRELDDFPDIPLNDFPFSKSEMKRLLQDLRNVVAEKSEMTCKLSPAFYVANVPTRGTQLTSLVT